MADINNVDAQAGARPGGRGRVEYGSAVLMLLFTAVVIAYVLTLSGSHVDLQVAWQVPLIFTVGCIGLIVGGCRVPMDINWLARRYNLDLPDGDFDNLPLGSEGVFFLVVFFVFFVLYLMGYTYVFCMPAPVEAGAKVIPAAVGAGAKVIPAAVEAGVKVIPSAVVIVNALATGAMAFFSARYCAYVGLLVVFSQLLSENSFDAGKSQESRERLLQKISECIHRQETYLEPPGNVFVTIGLASTFLGLAVALGSLNISEVLGQLNSKELDTSHKDAVLALTLFVRCMGLSLGMSMLGVVVALAAQWLRGKSGPPTTTDELLELCYRARETQKKAVLGPLDEKFHSAIQTLAQEMQSLKAAIAGAAERYAVNTATPTNIEPLVAQINTMVGEVTTLNHTASDIRGTLQNIETLTKPR